jgi:hypothetical protein
MHVRPWAIVALCCMTVVPAIAQVSVPAGPAAVHDIRPGPGVTATKMLSAWAPSLANTPGDTCVYILDGAEPGATVFVAGGTHGNEIAGIMAAIVLVEHVRVQRGRLIVIPHANNSAITDIDPQRPGPPFFSLTTPSGERAFRYGSRRTAASHQGRPDPITFRHPASEEDLDGAEARNLNRCYPGVETGTLTERMAFGIQQVIERERAALAFDFHEAPPGSRLAWVMVAHPKNIETAALAVVNLEMQGLSMRLEPSSDRFRGLSHREWGDASVAQTYLFETASPSMLNGTTVVDVVNDPTLPLSKRVGAQLACFSAVLAAYDESASHGRSVTLLDVPSMSDVEKAGVGAFVR